MDDKLINDLRDLKLENEAKAFTRWNSRREFRDDPAAFLEKNQDEKARMQLRYNNYNRREAILANTDQTAASAKAALERAIGLSVRVPERKIGDTMDLKFFPPSPEAYLFGTPVGRIFQVPDPGIEINAFGSGFLVAPNILLTNNHVLPYASAAEGVAVNFKYEYNQFRQRTSGSLYRLDPDTFFLSDQLLDYTFIYVQEIEMGGGAPLRDLGFLKLIRTKGKIVLKDPINIVQYPQGGPKQYATENNFVEDILEQEGFIQYTTDTDEASSGSPAGNKHWEVAALHHSGIAMTVNGKVWSRFNRPWDPSMTDEDKVYVANEGVSISSILANLEQKRPAKQSDMAHINRILQQSIDNVLADHSANPLPTTTDSIVVPATNLGNARNEPITDNLQTDLMSNPIFTFNQAAVVNIYNYPVGGVSGQLIGPKPEDGKVAIIAPEKKLRFDEQYSNRRYKGYKANFLDVSIPFPSVAEHRLGEIFMKPGTDEPLILKYYHYSLIMNTAFRLQQFSAVNVNYDPTLKTTRERDEFGDEGNSWRPDPRIPTEFQLTNEEFYKPATQVDRGHMVRRDDSCYGNTEMEIEYANSDTFHWTNCTPQHEGFNQSRQFGLWGLLENAVKDGLSGEDTKASIFAGPVLIEDPDRIYNGIHFPVKFWKVIATMEAGKLLAYGFMLDQSKVIDQRGLEAKFDFSQFVNRQMRLTKIQEEADVVFPEVLLDADIFVQADMEGDENEIGSEEDIVIEPV